MCQLWFLALPCKFVKLLFSVMEEWRREVQGHPWLPSRSEVCPDYMMPFLKRARPCSQSYLITKAVTIAITTSCLHLEVICCIPCSASNSVGQKEALQDITARAQPGMQSERQWKTGSFREYRVVLIWPTWQVSHGGLHLNPRKIFRPR